MSTGNILEEIIPRHILEMLTVVELKKKVVFIPLEEQKDIELYYILEDVYKRQIDTPAMETITILVSTSHSCCRA